jgi:metacaspase-1
MTKKLKILCIHGVGRHPEGGAWEGEWRTAILTSLRKADPSQEAEIEFVHHDAIFAKYRLTFWGTLKAVAKLTASAVGAPFRTARGGDGSLRWTAGMVVQWVENAKIRKLTRALLKERIEAFAPDVVCAHSLGSLIAYDTFTHPDTKAAVKGRYFVSLGSQIGNPFVAGNFLAGRIDPLREAKHWFHLYNSEDAVFTAQIRLQAPNFEQVTTYFDIDGMADHSAIEYLRHSTTIASVWTRVALEGAQPLLFRALDSSEKVAASAAAPKSKKSSTKGRRALLVGINQYPKPDMRLDGCVNDVFLMSSLLQESGFEADDIRVVLDDRATAKGIRDRLEWLLDDIGQDSGERIFYYSGHGAQIPSYGVDGRPDQFDEALVPHDFDWSAERAITDKFFSQLYSQLPYESRFVTILDCCHSGGMTRGRARVRGIDPPDDIRHRELKWNTEHEMWVSRDWKPREYAFAARTSDDASSVIRSQGLGLAAALRTIDDKTYDALRKERKHHGPYMPLLLYACRASEFAFEYRHGSMSYGAFTYCLQKHVRSHRRLAKGKKCGGLSFRELVVAVRKELKDLGYEQSPVAIGPKTSLNALVPGMLLVPSRPGRGRREPKAR